MSISVLEKERTIAAGLDAWLAHDEASGTLTGEALHSAKSFARAFKIWFDKANGANASVETLISEDLAMEFEFFADNFTMGHDLEDDYIEPTADLNPKTKTTYIASNAIAYITFLGNVTLTPPFFTKRQFDEAIAYLKTTGEDLKRTQRAEWVLRSHEMHYNPILGGTSERTLELEEEERQNLFEIADIGENFVLADTCDVTDTDSDPVGSPTDPVKIYIPRVVIPYLKVGDDLHIGIQRAKNADYWVITCLLAVESGTRKYEENDEPIDSTLSKLHLAEGEQEADAPPEISHLEMITTLRADPGYQARRAELLKVAPLNDGFPEDKYDEAWFASCELDIASDEEDIGGFWDMEDSDSDEDGEDIDSE